jgi:hypothetical protein
MTPMTLSTSASAADTAAAAPAIPPPPAPRASVSLGSKTTLATKVAKGRWTKDADPARNSDETPDDSAGGSPVADASDAVNGDNEKLRPQAADASSSPRVDPDHMAGALNRMQLDRGFYGSASRGHGPVPLSAGE